MGVKITDTTKWTIGAQVDPAERTEGLEFVSVSAGVDGKIRLAVNDGLGESVNTYLGPKGAVPAITVKVEWKDKTDGDNGGEMEEEEVRRPGMDWFGMEG